ncbi:unnamed protein product [Discosporangium mesarthrocarpum]
MFPRSLYWVNPKPLLIFSLSIAVAMTSAFMRGVLPRLPNGCSSLCSWQRFTPRHKRPSGPWMAASLTRTQIRRMRVLDIRSELEERGVDSEGTKPQLVERLIMANEGSSLREGEKKSFKDKKGGLRLGPGDGRGKGEGKQGICEGVYSAGPGRYILQFDGGSRGNPGPSGAGAVIFRVDDNGDRTEVWSTTLWVGDSSTNNQAEYSGLIAGLEVAERMGVKELVVEGDSNLVVQQMKGNFKVASPRMRPLFETAKDLSARFERLEITHIARALNSRADQLANEAMDGGGDGSGDGVKSC